MHNLPKTYLWGGAAALGALFLLTRKGFAESLAKGLVGAAEGAAVGTVKGIGKAVGIPDTNIDQCTIDIANGDRFAASRSCNATRFTSWWLMGNPDHEAEKLKFSRAENANHQEPKP